MVLRLILMIMLTSIKGVMAQTRGHNITIEITGMPDTLYQVGYYWGSQKYPLKEVSLQEGVMRLSGEEILPVGTYFVEKQGFTYDFLVKEQQFKLRFDLEDPYETLVVEGSEENQLFKKYKQMQNEFQKQFGQLFVSMQQAQGDDSVRLVRQWINESQSRQSKWNQFALDNEGTYTAQIARLMIDPSPPSMENIKDETQRTERKYQYYIEHYWDGIDLADVSLLRTPLLYGKVTNYLNRGISQHPDQLIGEIDRIMARCEGSKETFKFWSGTFLNEYHYSRAFGREAVYLHIVEEYFLSGQADWIPEKSLDFLKEDVAYMKGNLIGQVALPLLVKDEDQNKIDALRGTNGTYRVLFFYDPNCEHCMEVAPLLNSAYEKLSQLDVKLLSICTIDDRNQKNGFVEAYDLAGTHLMRSASDDSLHKDYDIRSTPKLYVINKHGTIVGRNLDVTQLVNYVEEAIAMNY